MRLPSFEPNYRGSLSTRALSPEELSSGSRRRFPRPTALKRADTARGGISTAVLHDAVTAGASGVVLHTRAYCRPLTRRRHWSPHCLPPGLLVEIAPDHMQHGLYRAPSDDGKVARPLTNAQRPTPAPPTSVPLISISFGLRLREIPRQFPRGESEPFPKPNPYAAGSPRERAALWAHARRQSTPSSWTLM
jgi:hypothetical protein